MNLRNHIRGKKRGNCRLVGCSGTRRSLKIRNILCTMFRFSLMRRVQLLFACEFILHTGHHQISSHAHSLFIIITSSYIPPSVFHAQDGRGCHCCRQDGGTCHGCQRGSWTCHGLHRGRTLWTHGIAPRLC